MRSKIHLSQIGDLPLKDPRSTSPDKGNPPVYICDVGVLHVAIAEETLDSLIVKVHVEGLSGEATGGGGCLANHPHTGDAEITPNQGHTDELS